jgi:hypothetical protein
LGAHLGDQAHAPFAVLLVAVLHEVWNAMGQAIVIISAVPENLPFRLLSDACRTHRSNRDLQAARLREAKRAMRDRILRARDAIPRRHRAHAGARS